MGKYTVNEIKEQIKQIWSNEYEYDYSTYVNKSKPIRVICHKRDKNGNEHGEFWMTLDNHLNKTRKEGCPICGRERSNAKKRLSYEIINDRIQKKSHGKYSVSTNKEEYVNNQQIVKFVCSKHGEFKKKCDEMLKNPTCKQCEKEKRDLIKLEEFKNKLKTFTDKITLCQDSKYNGLNENIELFCYYKDENGEEHGKYLATPYNVLHGQRCKKCKRQKLKEIRRLPFNIVEERMMKKHDGLYEYDEKSYVDTHSIMQIKCKKHGWFPQTPHAHLQGQGCPICGTSHIETEIRRFLQKNNIEFEEQKRFEWLGLQSLDFYLPKYNAAIECQGIQHFKPIEHFGNIKGYEIVQERDKRKLSLCKENHVKLLYYANYEYEFPYKVIMNKDKLLEEICKTKQSIV